MQQSNESTGGLVWWVRCGDEVLGSLSSPFGDQPWMVARFEPSDRWERVRHLFEAQAEARRLGFPEDKVSAVKAVMDLHLELQPAGEGPVIRPMLIYIEGHEARFRT